MDALLARLARYEILIAAGDLSYVDRAARLRSTIAYHSSGEAARVARLDEENASDGDVAISYRNS